MDGEEREFVDRGSHRFRDGALEIAWRFWSQPSGELQFRPVDYTPGAITLRWGHPADGPDIIEVYRKE